MTSNSIGMGEEGRTECDGRTLGINYDYNILTGELLSGGIENLGTFCFQHSKRGKTSDVFPLGISSFNIVRKG
jgi:hypothetical protein